MLPVAADRYTLTAADLMDRDVLLNRTPLRLGSDDALPAMAGEATAAGAITFAPASITFLAVPSARTPIYQ